VTVAGLRGMPAAINFWASWCTPCRREAPELEQLHRARRTPGTIVGVNWNDRLSGARAFVRDHRWTFPNLRDADGSVGRAYAIVGLPTTVILDSHGRIAQVLAGLQTVGSIRQAFNSTR
jgi:thiol-disulfide isomerase/thioredoxin